MEQRQTSPSEQPDENGRSWRERKGFALAAAVLALVVVGALVTGGFYAASQESRISVATESGERAFRVAEHGMDQLLANVTRSDLDTLAYDTTVVIRTGQVQEGGEAVGDYTVTIRRLGIRLFFAVSAGEVLTGGRYSGARRSLGMMVRTLNANYPMDRALQISDTLTVTGSSSISGVDNPPGNWSECDSLSTQPAIVAQDSSGVTQEGSATIEGDPPVTEDATMDEGDFGDFGDVTWDELVAGADITLNAGESMTQIEPEHVNGVCDTDVRTNWGAPLDSTDVCHYYFPTIYAPGNLYISADDAGQGILLVDGDLDLSGGFEFYGVVIVQGSLISEGTGSHLNGVVMVAGGTYLETDSATTESSAAGNSIVNFSSCAIQRVKDYGGRTRRPVPLMRRAWMDLSAVGWR